MRADLIEACDVPDAADNCLGGSVVGVTEGAEQPMADRARRKPSGCKNNFSAISRLIL